MGASWRSSPIPPSTAQIRSQPEFNEALWQYINRRVSDWRIITGKARAKEHAPLLARIESDYGVDRYIMLALWGVEFELSARSSTTRNICGR